MHGGARRWALVPALALTVALLLTACSEEGGGLPSGSGSRTASLLPSRTASLPTPTGLPSRTRTASPTEEPTQAPTEAPSESPSPSPSASEAPTKTAAPPSASPSEESPTREPTATPTPSATAPTSEAPTESATASESATVSATASPDAEEAAEDTASDETGVDEWVWWLIAFLVLLGGAVAAILVPRARRRRAWDDGLTEAEREARWLAEELLPQLQQAGSPDEVAGGWQVAAGRATAAEDRLTGLETSAPDEARGARAVALRDAVRAARQGVEDLLVTRDPATLGRGLALLASRLSAALVGSRST